MEPSVYCYNALLSAQAKGGWRAVNERAAGLLQANFSEDTIENAFIQLRVYMGLPT